jgi:hypothetical protein
MASSPRDQFSISGVLYPFTKRVNGCSMASAIHLRNLAVSAPSIILLSQDRDNGRMERVSKRSSRSRSSGRVREMPRMAT